MVGAHIRAHDLVERLVRDSHLRAVIGIERRVADQDIDLAPLLARLRDQLLELLRRLPADFQWFKRVTMGQILVIGRKTFESSGRLHKMLGVHLFGQGINLCYHRQLTHHSFRTPRWLERFFSMIAMCCLEGPPGRWVATHRFHHNHSDEQEDPHSPLVAFFWGHIGWLLLRNTTTPGAICASEVEVASVNSTIPTAITIGPNVR
jgi:hypothetical protein